MLALRKVKSTEFLGFQRTEEKIALQITKVETNKARLKLDLLVCVQFLAI